VRAGIVAVQRDVHLLQQGAQQLLAVLVGGGRGVPHLAEVAAESQDGLFLLRGEGFRACGLAAGQLSFGVGQFAECGLPFALQPAGDQPVVRVDGPVAALGPGCLVAGLLDLALVLGQGSTMSVFELPGRLQARVERGRGQRGQERGGDGGV